MRSQKQIEASRRNGARSRGPVTSAGKAISSQNALRHGRHSRNPEAPLRGVAINPVYEIQIDAFLRRKFPDADSRIIQRLSRDLALKARLPNEPGTLVEIRTCLNRSITRDLDTLYFQATNPKEVENTATSPVHHPERNPGTRAVNPNVIIGDQTSCPSAA